jgi:hypothetical protein
MKCRNLRVTTGYMAGAFFGTPDCHRHGVCIPPPPEPSVEFRSASDVRHRNDDDIELHVNRPRSRGLGCRFAAGRGTAHIEFPSSRGLKDDNNALVAIAVEFKEEARVSEEPTAALALIVSDRSPQIDNRGEVLLRAALDRIARFEEQGPCRIVLLIRRSHGGRISRLQD